MVNQIQNNTKGVVMPTKIFNVPSYSGKTVIVDPIGISLVSFSLSTEGLEIILSGDSHVLDQVELVEVPTHILVAQKGAVQVR